MRLGLIARMDNSGLGIQTHEFYEHMKPSKTMVVDMSGHNGNGQYPQRYPERATFISGTPTPGDINEFLDDLDCVFVAEAPYNYYLYEAARQRGIKTAVQYNYEFFDWFLYTNLPRPDMLIAPSRWHYNDVQNWCEANGVKHTYLHCPVDRTKLRFRTIDHAKTFLHIVGRAAAHDRNGTATVIAASRYIESNAQIVIHFQGEQGLGHQVTHTFDDYQRMLVETGGHQISMQQNEYDNYEELYKTGDVLLLPRRYGGNCLPMNEALSCGMPVIMTSISPNNEFLDQSWLIGAQLIGQFSPRTIINIYGADPVALAHKIDEFANMPPEQIMAHNLIADGLAKKIDWSIMRSRYVETLENLCKG